MDKSYTPLDAINAQVFEQLEDHLKRNVPENFQHGLCVYHSIGREYVGYEETVVEGKIRFFLKGIASDYRYRWRREISGVNQTARGGTSVKLCARIDFKEIDDGYTFMFDPFCWGFKIIKNYKDFTEDIGEATYSCDGLFYNTRYQMIILRFTPDYPLCASEFWASPMSLEDLMNFSIKEKEILFGENEEEQNKVFWKMHEQIESLTWN